MQDKIDRLILNSRIATLIVELNEALCRTEEGGAFHDTLTAMKTIVEEEYEEFKSNIK